MPLNKLLICCLLLPSPLLAAWSGINFSIGDESIPITSNNEEFALTPFNLQLSVEDSISGGLRIGGSIAKNGVKINGGSTKIDSSSDSIGLYLNLPYQLNDYIGITSRLSVTKYVSTINDDTEGEVDYLTKQFSLGLSLKWQHWRVTPTINAFSINGDFKRPSDPTTFSFKEKQSIYTSLSVDYFAERNSFIRFSLTEHSDSTFRISFTNIY